MIDDLWRLPGVGGELQNIYMESAQIPDYRFSWIAVTALFSVIGARKYKTVSGNYTPLAMMVLARSSSGKNHILEFIEACLQQSGLSHLSLNKAGASSVRGLFQIMKRSPSQIIIIDEAAHAREGGKGNPHLMQVRGQLMSMMGSAEGTFSLPETSDRGLGDKELKAKREQERPIKNPALVYVEISTAEKLLNGLNTMDAVSGELGRYLIVGAGGGLPIMTEGEPEPIDLPDDLRLALARIRHDIDHQITEEEAYQSVKDEVWAEHVACGPTARGLLKPTDADIKARVNTLKATDPGFMENTPDNPDRPPVPIVFQWEHPDMRNNIFREQQITLLSRYWEEDTDIYSKKHEHAMRLSLIYSLMDPDTYQRRVVSREHAQKAVEVVNYLIGETDRLVVPLIADNDVQRAVNAAVEAIKSAGGKPVSYDSWKTKASWKRLDSTAKRVCVLEALEDYPILPILNPDATNTGKFNKFRYVWCGTHKQVSNMREEFHQKQQEAKA